MGRVIPTGRFTVRQQDGRYIFVPDGPLRDSGIHFVAELRRDGDVLLHDDGTILQASSRYGLNSVDVVKEIRFASASSGFRFRDGRVMARIPRDDLEGALRRLERLASEVYHKSTMGLGGD